MAKKLSLITVLVVWALAPLAGATTVSLIEPAPGELGSAANPLGLGETLRVYVAVDDSGLSGFAATVTVSNTSLASITGGITAAEAVDYGGQGTYNDPPGSWSRTGNDGWQSQLSFDTIVYADGSMAEMGLGQFGNTVYGPTTVPVVTFDMTPPDGTSTNTPIAYVDIIGNGAGAVTLNMVPGIFQPSPPYFFGDPITIYTIPEPMTIVMLGLGGLMLLRKRRT